MEFVSNLQKVIFRITRRGGIQALFQSPKCLLKAIELYFTEGSTDVKKVADTFAAKWITTLDSVTFYCALPSRNAFQMVATRNKRLRYVHIELRNLKEVAHDVLYGRISEIVECFFFECPTLELFEITEREDNKRGGKIDSVTDALRTKHRHRRVYVSIFGNYYN